MTHRPLHVLGVNGSLHEKGGTIELLKRLLQMVEQRGAEVRLLDLREVTLPLYRPDDPSHASAQERVGMDMDWAEAVVLGSPDYHGSMSGAMKNFLDYVWEECAGKLFGYLCASHEKGLTVMDQMRVVVRQCYGWSLPYGVSYNPREDLDGEVIGFTNARIERRLKMMAGDLVTMAGRCCTRSSSASDLAAEHSEDLRRGLPQAEGAIVRARVAESAEIHSQKLRSEAAPRQAQNQGAISGQKRASQQVRRGEPIRCPPEAEIARLRHAA